jgi:hypothetical protein
MTTTQFWQQEAAFIKDTSQILDRSHLLLTLDSDKTDGKDSIQIKVNKQTIKVSVETPNEKDSIRLYLDKNKYKSILGYGESRTQEDFRWSENREPSSEPGRRRFKEIIMRWAGQTIHASPAETDKLNNEIKESLEQSLVCPNYFSNTFLLNQMYSAIGNAGKLSGREDISMKFWRRYQENNIRDFFNTQDVANLLWKESDQGEKMIKEIVTIFSDAIESSNFNENAISLAMAAQIRDRENIIKPNIRRPAVLLAVVGGTQELNIRLIKLEKILEDQSRVLYESELLVHLFDDFGVSEDDWGDDQVESFEDFFSFKLVKSLDSYREPLMAFWILQHQRNIKPFRTVLTFKLKFTASYPKRA